MIEGIFKKVNNDKIKLLGNIFFGQFLHLLYRYNIIILKNDEYKKIVVAFPGITYIFQIFEEIIHSELVELSIKENDAVFRVSKMYNEIFTLIETDLFDNLKNIQGINDKDYQVIFTGH